MVFNKFDLDPSTRLLDLLLKCANTFAETICFCRVKTFYNILGFHQMFRSDTLKIN